MGSTLRSPENDLAPNVSVGEPEDGLFSARDYLRVIRRRIWIVALVILAFPGIAVGLSLLQAPQYEASIKILVGQEQRESSDYNLGGDVQGLQQLTVTLSTAVSSRPLAEAVIRDLDLGITPQRFLEDRLRVEQIPETQFIDVSYTAFDAEEARDAANTVGEVFSEQVSEVSETTSGVTATVWEPAVLPATPVSPNPIRAGLLALVLGVVFGVGLAFLLEYLDDSWQSPEEVEQVSGVPALAIIPEHRLLKTRK